MSGLVDPSGRPMGKPVPRYVDVIGIPIIGDAVFYMNMVPPGAALQVNPDAVLHPMVVALWISTSVALGKQADKIEALEAELEKLRTILKPEVQA